MTTQEELIILFEKWSGEKIKTFSPLPNSGSNRKYFRLTGETKNAIGALNSDKRENKAFIYLSKHLGKQSINVPQVYSSNLKNGIYLQEDLGDETLFNLLNKERNDLTIPGEIIKYYKSVITELPKIQINGAKGLDYSNCYPRAAFDSQSIKWDLSYFKYYFLKMTDISFDEQKLEDDFDTFTKFLLQADKNYFMYRDFNSRNIMIKNGEPFFYRLPGGKKRRSSV